jgi:hypothetical protein
MIAERESTQDTQDTFVNHLLKKIDRIFSEAIASQKKLKAKVAVMPNQNLVVTGEC